MRKKLRGDTRYDLLDSLHDDIVLSILCKLISSASSPADLFAVVLTCKRMNNLALHPLILSKLSSKVLAVRAKNWCDGAHRFFKLCVNAGNKEACYILGMIRFYCLQNRGSGVSLMAKAASKSHAQALYSLAVIQFNGSGGLKKDKDLRAGVALCARSAFLGHVDALRELGHCLQDGYGVQKNLTEGRRLLVQANARELASVFRDYNSGVTTDYSDNNKFKFKLFNDYGFNVTKGIMHPVNKFLVEWFGLREEMLSGQGLRVCCYKECGRPETRKNEFRRCSGCGKVNYCSRGCQAHDWRVNHKVECAPIEDWLRHAIEDNVNGGDDVIDDQTVEIVDGGVEGI